MPPDRVLQSEVGNAFANQLEPVSNDIFPGDLHLETDISGVHSLLFRSIHVINVTDFQHCLLFC